MGRRWTDQDVSKLRDLAQEHPAHRIAEIIDRTVGGVVFKAHTLKVSLQKHRPSVRVTGNTEVGGVSAEQ